MRKPPRAWRRVGSHDALTRKSRKVTEIQRGASVTVRRYTAAARVNHWITAISLVLLALSGLALFHPSLFFLTGLFGGGLLTRMIHPFIGVVLFLSFLGLFARFWKLNLWGHTDNVWLGRLKDVLTGRDENLPEVGKYNAGQKMVFWSMSLLIVVLVHQRHRHLAAVFRQLLHGGAEAYRRADPCRNGDRRHLCLDRPCLCGDLGSWHDRRHDPRPGDRRLGVASSSSLAEGTRCGQAGGQTDAADTGRMTDVAGQMKHT